VNPHPGRKFHIKINTNCTRNQVFLRKNESTQETARERETARTRDRESETVRAREQEGGEAGKRDRNSSEGGIPPAEEGKRLDGEGGTD
jgi:hypothetical protein